MTLPTERIDYGQQGRQLPPPPPGFMAWQGAVYNDPNTGESWQILLPDLPYADLLTPQTANYFYQNIQAYNMRTGQTQPLRSITTESVESQIPFKDYMSTVSYQALTNELIQEGVQEEDFKIPEVQNWLKTQMGQVVIGRPMEQVKSVAGWMKYVGETQRSMQQTQESWKLHQSTPANVWMDKDIIRQMNPQGYQSDDYQWKPLVQKATSKPQRITTL